MNSQDQKLIDECLAGRTDAFDRLVLRYQDRLYNTLVSVLGSADDARDVVQDAFVHAFQKLSTFSGRSAFYSWLFRIAINAAVNRKRRVRRTVASIDGARDEAGIEPADIRPDAQPSYFLELSERQRLLRVALAELSEEHRMVIVLKEMEGLKYEEIAELIGCPVGTVRSRLFRARSELRQKLAAFFQDD